MGVTIGPCEQRRRVGEERDVQRREQRRRAQQEDCAQGDAGAAERLDLGGHRQKCVAVVRCGQAHP